MSKQINISSINILFYNKQFVLRNNLVFMLATLIFIIFNVDHLRFYPFLALISLFVFYLSTLYILLDYANIEVKENSIVLKTKEFLIFQTIKEIKEEHIILVEYDKNTFEFHIVAYNHSKFKFFSNEYVNEYHFKIDNFKERNILIEFLKSKNLM